MVRRRRRGSRHPASGVVLAVSLALALALGLAGCGAPAERQEAGAAADRFAADEAADPAAACALLAPRTLESVEKNGTPCPQALPEDDLPAPGSRGVVSVAGHSAQVRFTGDTVFLALFDDGWKVTAAGCSRTSDDPATPYDCAIELMLR